MSFQQGLSGLNVSSKTLDVIGNNIANSGTVGFKAGQAQFADVFAASLAGAGTSPVGLGAKVADVVQQFTQGNVTTTNNPLDIAINGGGFYRLDKQGSILYARNGQFQLDKNGFVVTSGGLRLTGYAATASGTINTGAITDVQISNADVAPQATGTATLGVAGVVAKLNMDSRAPIIAAAFNFADPTTYNNSAALTVYDSLGSPSTYTFYFKKTAANTWNVQTTITNPAGTTTSEGLLGTMVFNSSGVLTTAMPFAESIPFGDLNTGAATLPFNVDFGGTTQFGGDFGINTLSQDGFAFGKLSGFNVGRDGIVVGSYTNGQTKNLGQVILASFRNPQGLQPLGDNVWAETSDSGVSLLGTPGSSGAYGALQSAAVEDSNVDLTAELVNLITAQRVYQANAQTIKAQDSVLQTLVNLR